MDMNPAAQPQFVSTGGRRTDRRQFDATVQFGSGTKRAAVKLRDISCIGARVAGVFLVREGDRLFLTLPGLAPIEAQVAWTTQFEFGCQFLQPLSPFVLDAIVARG
jgi:hypothetical protein